MTAFPRYLMISKNSVIHQCVQRVNDARPAYGLNSLHRLIYCIIDFLGTCAFLGYTYMADLPHDQVAHDFDIAVHVRTRGGRRYIPYFDILTDEVFQAYIDRGAKTRAQFIITKEERDANPLTCDGEWFTTPGQDADWVQLN